MSQTKTKKRSAPKHFTREHQQYARSRVSSESCSINGAKGARVTIERYGVDALFNRWQAWKLAITISRWKGLARRRFEVGEITDQAAFESHWPQILTNFFYAETARVSWALSWLSEDRNN